MSYETTLAEIKSAVGTETHLGPWLEITQEMIDAFADVTIDHQWIHTDPERAAQDSPYKSTVAHGFLTLSLIPHLSDSVNPDRPIYPGVKLGVNYGLNRVRFPHPVKPGDKIRARTELQSVEEVPGGVQTVSKITIELEGAEKPCCVAEIVARFYF